MSGRTKVLASAGDGTSGTSAAESCEGAGSGSAPTRDIGGDGSKRGRLRKGARGSARSNTPTGVGITADPLGAAKVVAAKLDADTDDASQEGWKFHQALMKTDEVYRRLVGCLTVLYAVKNRKVQNVNARTYKTAKEAIVTFAATTTAWRVQGVTGDRRWGRGSLRPTEEVQGRAPHGDLDGMGRRSSGLRRLRSCPTCGNEAFCVFKTQAGVRCTKCVRPKSPSGQATGGPADGKGCVSRPDASKEMAPEALEVLIGNT